MGVEEALGSDGCIHDEYRIDYQKRHIQELKGVMEEGTDTSHIPCGHHLISSAETAVKWKSGMGLFTWISITREMALVNVYQRIPSTGTLAL